VKFPRNARIFQSQLDATPFAIVFFLLVIFLMLASLVYTPGVRLQLPMADDLPGADKPTVAVAIDGSGRLYYANQEVTDEQQLQAQLRAIVKTSPTPPALLVQADAAVRNEQLVHLALLARGAGITDAWLATLSRPLAASKPAHKP
jgi:biopolymer transport protein ExbD